MPAAPAAPVTTTYGVTLKGERHTFAIAAWAELDFEALCTVLSDVTGYRAAFLAEDLPKRFDRLGYAAVKPAALHDGEVPVFLVRSSDGTAPRGADARAQGMADSDAGRPSRFAEFAPDAGRSDYIRGYADAVRARQEARA